MQQQSSKASPPEKLLTRLSLKLGSNVILYTIMEETPNAILIVDENHKLLYGNPAASSFLGYRYGELTDLPVQDLLAADQDPVMMREFASFSATRTFSRNFRCETILKDSKNGNQRSVEMVFVQPHERSDHYAIILIDIDERKTLEIELRRSNEFFHNLIDSSVDGIIAADMKGKIILFNQGAQQLLGYSSREAMNNVHVSRLYPNGEAKRIIKRMRSDEYGGKGKLLRHELTAITKDGEHIPMSLSGGVLYDDYAEEIATFGIFTDLRRIQKFEEDLQQTHHMLQESEKMAGLGRLAAGVAHEINNPMSGIMIFSNLVREQLGDDNELSQDLDVVINEAERCKNIVADLLEFSHQTSYDKDRIDLNEVLLKTLALLEKQPLFHNVSLQLNLTKESTRIYGNAPKLSQVFMNIIVNSAQAMDGKGCLDISSSVRSYGDIIEFVLQDSGPGIKQANLQKIFEPFFTTKDYGEGTGLGLSVSYAIVKEHHGTIHASSEVGKGAMFRLKFPVQESAKTGESE